MLSEEQVWAESNEAHRRNSVKLLILFRELQESRIRDKNEVLPLLGRVTTCSWDLSETPSSVTYDLSMNRLETLNGNLKNGNFKAV